MGRYLRIIHLFWTSALAAEMEYRLNFFLAAITSVGNFVGSLFVLHLFYRQQYHFHGWTWQEALLVMGMFTLLDGVSSTWLTPNLSKIVNHVQKGTLDFVLLKPLDSQFWLSTRNLSPWGIPSLCLGLLLIGYSAMQVGVSAANLLIGAVFVLLSIVILYSIWYILGTMTIWFVKIYNVTEVFRSVMEAGKYPVTAYPAAYRFFLTFILPVAFLTTVPAEALRGRAAPAALLAELALAAGLFTFSRFFWRFALRFYTSASS